MPSHIRESKIEARLNELFGHETSIKDLKISKKFVELFGDAPNPNKNLIRDIKKKKKLILLFGELPKPVKKIKKRKNSKKIQAQIKKRFDELFGIENTRKDKIVAKKIIHLFGQE